MSGGSLSYFYAELQSHVGDFDDKELDDLVSDLADLFYVREWYLSCDKGEDDWNKARKAFKDKWFAPDKRPERIEKYIAEMSKEIRKAFGIEDPIL